MKSRKRICLHAILVLVARRRHMITSLEEIAVDARSKQADNQLPGRKVS